MKPFNKKYALVLALAIIGVFLIIAGTSYAFFTNTSSADTDFVLRTGELSIAFDNDTDVIEINNAYPMSSANGLNTTPYSFTVTNDGDFDVKYRIRLEEYVGPEMAQQEMVPKEYVKVSLHKDNVMILEPTRLANLDRLILENNALLESSDDSEYDLRIWVDLGAGNDNVGKYIAYQVVVDAIQTDGDLNDIPINVVDGTTEFENVNLTGAALVIYQNSIKRTGTPSLADENGQPISSSNCEWQGVNGYECTTVDAGGLYRMNVTDGYGGTDGYTYYFRGRVNNNYVKFGKWTEPLYYGYASSNSVVYKRYSSLSACQNAANYNYRCTLIHDAGDDMTWRIVRINEDQTIRLVLDSEANTVYTDYNTSKYNVSDMYYTNSSFKTLVDNWYNSTIGNNPLYSSKVATGNYFCEAAKTTYDDTYNTGSATMAYEDEYLPDLKCQTDGNGYGLVNSSVGLLTYDELRLAGASQSDNIDYYLYKELYYATMTPAGMDTENYTDDFGDPTDMATIWAMYAAGGSYSIYPVEDSEVILPVINLKNTITITGTGTTRDPYIIQ